MIPFSSIDGGQPLIFFTSSTTGYLYLCHQYNPWTVKVYKTTDGFQTSQEIYSDNPPPQYYFRLKDIFLSTSGSIVAVGHNGRTNISNTDYYRLRYDGQFFSRSYGTSIDGYLRFLYGALTNSGERYIGTQSVSTYPHLPGTRFYVNFNEQGSILIDQQTDYSKVGGLSFSDGLKGFTTVDNSFSMGQVYITNNGGNSWGTPEWTFGSSVGSIDGHHRVKSFGDVCYAAESQGRFNTRKIQSTLNTNFDWRGNPYPNQYTTYVDGVPYLTPQSPYLRGGTSTLSVGGQRFVITGTDTTAQFYYWGGTAGNTSLDAYGNQNYFINQGDINADYKTILKSTTSSALSNANQVKALKDTNGVTNLIYESMGGIFYTRTKHLNGLFKTEERVSGTSGSSGYATFNNTNPYITEFKPINNGNVGNTETNVVAAWERREGNNNNIIKILSGGRNVVGPYLVWNYGELVTLQNLPSWFSQAFPKLFASRHQNNGNTVASMSVLTYLAPDGNNTKIMARVYNMGGLVSPEVTLVSPGNITDYSVVSTAPIPNGYGNWFILEIAYKRDQSIYFKEVSIGLYGGGVDWHVLETDRNISNGENSLWRNSPNITLKNLNNSNDPYNTNMQPVVTYQGQYAVRIIIENEFGPPLEVPGTYYPIYVRERLATNSWAGYIIYQSLNTPQQNPNIEGSKLKNSCILNFARNSTTHRQVVPRWNNGQPNTYFCDPNQFIGTDAKFRRSTLVNASSTIDTLMTLSSSIPLYQLGGQRFIITNQPSGSGAGFDEINGIVMNDNVKYSFNLGSIMVNWNLIGFDTDVDTTITDGSEFNEIFTSRTFGLFENDSLVIGRNAFYIVGDSNSTFQEVEYWVKLTNNTTGVMHKLLAHDTVHVHDTIQVEYLEGFVIRNIPNGFDSFYVQLEADTLVGVGYGIGGGIGGAPGGGDNVTFKKKIFWEGENKNIVKSEIPTTFALYQNYPNPFNPITRIKYDIPQNVNVTLKIYDLLGREVATLINNEFKIAGRYLVEWNANNFASGIYIYRIEAGKYIDTKKMVLVK